MSVKALNRIRNRTFLREVSVPYIEPTGDLWEIHKDIPEVFKWHHYYTHYEEKLAPFRARPIKLLEIGVRFGGSIKLFKEYLHPDSLVVGIDIEERCTRYEKDRMPIEIGDQADEEFLQEVIDKHGPFDVIIDDGSHLSHHQRISWQFLFREGLNPEGLYVVEDAYNSYFAEMTEGGTEPFMNTVKLLIDLMHMNYAVACNTGPFLHNDPTGFGVAMEYYEAWVNSIDIRDGMVFFQKRMRSAPVSPQSIDATGEEHGLV